MNIKEYKRLYYINNKEKWKTIYHENAKKKPLFSEKSRISCLKNYYNNKDKYKNYSIQYREKNREKLNIKNKEWMEKNKEKRKVYNREYSRRKMVTDKNFLISALLRKRLLNALRGDKKIGSFVKDLGCSIDDFKKYIENKFTDGMNWENRGKWHFDHIKPLSSFDMKNREEFLKAAHYTNYQPLWAKDNMKKGAKY